MRAILTCLLLLGALTAFFAGMAAIGIFGLHWQKVAVASASIPTSRDADRDEDDEPTLAAAAIPPAASAPSSPDPPPSAPAPPVVRPVPAAPAPPPDVHVDHKPAQPQVIELSAIRAIAHGRMIRVEAVPGGYAVVGWSDPDAYVQWPLADHAPGRYRVELAFSCDDQSGGDFELIVAEQSLTGRARTTGGADRYQTTTLGTIQLPVDASQVVLKPGWRLRGALMNVRSVRLVPAP